MWLSGRSVRFIAHLPSIVDAAGHAPLRVISAGARPQRGRPSKGATMGLKEQLAERFNPKVGQALDAYTVASPFANMLGMRIVEAGPGFVVAEMPIESKHGSGVGAVHGGAMVSLLDHVLSLTVYPLVEVGKW